MAGCLKCGKELQGRSDKKFCDDHCRSSYNNSWLSETNNYIRNVNRILRKNRKILSSLIVDGETIKVTEYKLVSLGFNFKYFTNVFNTKSGKTYYFCYDYGWLALGNEKYAIVAKKEYVN